jgi:hypothetical protein
LFLLEVHSQSTCHLGRSTAVASRVFSFIRWRWQQLMYLIAAGQLQLPPKPALFVIICMVRAMVTMVQVQSHWLALGSPSYGKENPKVSTPPLVLVLVLVMVLVSWTSQ